MADLPSTLTAAVRHAEATAAAVEAADALGDDAQRQHRAALALLAAELRATADAELGSVMALCRLAEAWTGRKDPRRKTPALTVRSTLYRRFVPEHLMACVEALSARRTAGPSAPIPHAA